jgi:hypothetical protein
MISFTKVLDLKRRFALGVSALFILALTASQPHRVHHFFDSSEWQHHGEGDSSRHHSKPPAKTNQSECVVQAVSQHCSAIPVELATLPILGTNVEISHPVLSRWVHRFVSSPFSQRAPPEISSSFSI